MDLTKQSPRAGSEALGGWVWLPRMIDKARALYQGNPGTYRHPCSRDLTLLSLLGLSIEEFREIVESTSNDEELLELLQRHRADKGLS